MSYSEPVQPPDEIDVRQLGNAIRFVFFAVVFGLSSIAVGICQSIDGFERIFMDMLGGRPLPLATQLIISGRPFFVVASLLVPAAAVAALFSRRLVASIYVMSALGLFAICESIFLYTALFLPLIDIIKQMGQGAGG